MRLRTFGIAARAVTAGAVAVQWIERTTLAPARLSDQRADIGCKRRFEHGLAAKRIIGVLGIRKCCMIHQQSLSKSQKMLSLICLWLRQNHSQCPEENLADREKSLLSLNPLRTRLQNQ